jgi:DNA-binding transcriptional ArsR family regulator
LRISTTREIVTRRRVQALLAAGLSGGEIARLLGISKSTVSYHKRRLGHAVDVRCNRRYDWAEVYLVKGRRVNRMHLKGRLMAAGLKENRCERCGIEEWLGEPLAMALHHVNGEGTDNRLENLMMLCPNCHSQTENFSGRGRKRVEAA